MLTLEIIIFGLKTMVKNGLEKIILKFHELLQIYLLTCQANSAFLGRFFCTGQQQLLAVLGGVNKRKELTVLMYILVQVRQRFFNWSIT